MPGLQPRTEAEPAQPWLRSLEVSHPPWDTDGTPNRHAAESVASKLSFSFLHLQPIATGLTYSAPSAASLLPKGCSIYLSPLSLRHG